MIDEQPACTRDVIQAAKDMAEKVRIILKLFFKYIFLISVRKQYYR